MERYEFCLGEAFPAEDELAQWIASLSIALGDLRTVWTFLRRDEQPDHERLYFARLMACHMRELVKVLERAPRERPVLKEFLKTLGKDGRELHERILGEMNERLALRPDRTLLDDMKRIRDTTWHYPLDKEFVAQLRDAMRRAAASGSRGAYVVFDTVDDSVTREHRAEFADLFSQLLAFPFDGDEGEVKEQFRELQERLRDLLSVLLDFLQRVEENYLMMRGVGFTRAGPEPS